MATDIVIPTIGESVTEGVIASWTKAEGEWVERDETVLELETDKITMEIPAPIAGVVKHSAGEGDTVEVGAVVGTVDESAEKPAGSKTDSQNGSAASAEPAPAAKAESATAVAEPPKKEAPPAAPAASAPAPSSSGGDSDAKATPLARKMAQEHSVNLANVHATGAGGRIREQDVLAYIQAGGNGQAPAPAAAPAKSERGVRTERMSQIRQRIAARLVEAQQTAAMLTTFNECDMGPVMELRKKYKDDFSKKHDINLGFMSFFVKAVTKALGEFPLINSFITTDETGKPAIQSHDYCDISVAVSSPKGLVVPVIRNAENLTFAGIESSIKDLAVRARDGKISLEEMSGGTFTITNGGIFGSLMSTPILNPPQSAILGMHTIKQRPAEDINNPGQIALRPMMYLALSYDHRIVDGAEAVQFLVSIKNSIEDPTRLLIDV